jgi:hypothetical protein
MNLNKGIGDAMRLRGFKLAAQGGSYIWFVKSRPGPWIDAFCFHLHSNGLGFSLSFGIEHASLRTQVLADASAISPKSFSKLAAPPFNTLERPSINTFPANIPNPAASVDPAVIDAELIDSINSEFFESIDSDAGYLRFLKSSTGVLDWRRSAASFRLLYVAHLYYSQGMTSSEFAEFCISIPKNSLEGHILVRQEGWTSETYVEACIKRIWN